MDEHHSRSVGLAMAGGGAGNASELLHNGEVVLLLETGGQEAAEFFECDYKGTDYLEVKIVLIGVFATGLALLSFLFNAFFSLVFALNSRLRRSPLYYFGVLALLDLALALNYMALMSVPVYMDQFRLLWLYHLFLAYLRPMLALSNFAMFASVLMILLATAERLLQTFAGHRTAKARRLLQRHRPGVSLLVMGASFAYKLCTYFELKVVEHPNCTEFERFEVKSAVESPEWAVYRFWWMFVTRNVVDHIVPFFLLVILNFFIIRALNREHIRAAHSFARSMVAAGAVPSLTSSTGGDGSSEKGSVRSKSSERRNTGSGRSLRESIRQKVRRARLQKSASTAEDQAQKKNLRAATRTLIAVVSMYLMSKVPQVCVTVFETFGTEDMLLEANYGEFRPIYSYLNDAISILTLMSSTLRFPVYCACNKPILDASKATLRRLLLGPDGGDQSGQGAKRKKTPRAGPALLLRRYSAEADSDARRATDEERCPLAFCAGMESPPGKRRVLKFVQNGKGRAVNGPAAARIAANGYGVADMKD